MSDADEKSSCCSGEKPSDEKSSCCSGEKPSDEKSSCCSGEKSSCCTEENWQDQLKKVLFAGVGVMSIAQVEVESVIKKLVEKGALAEKEGRKWIKEVVGKHYKQTKEKVQSIESSLDVEGMLKKISLPTKAQFEKLSKNVEELNKKVDELCQKIKS
jgi:poly(hydroxyalkanoate) granule-associated protein